MNNTNAQRILELMGIKCPLCDERFKYRANIRNHLKRLHTDADAEHIIYILEK